MCLLVFLKEVLSNKPSIVLNNNEGFIGLSRNSEIPASIASLITLSLPNADTINNACVFSNNFNSFNLIANSIPFRSGIK